ncbi:MAG: DUF1844 domain-containing protein [bacterium]|nr:DUF1844 domain-containing protein [bacterium]
MAETRTKTSKDQDPMFLSLILSLAQAALVCLGKMKGQNGDIKVDLDQASLNIGMIRVLKEKTQNNLTKDEAKSLSSTLKDLEVHYTDEANKN